MLLALLLAFAPIVHAETPTTGDLFVVSDIPGAAISLDGAGTGQVTPVMLHSIPVGAHTITIRTSCSAASADTTVTPGGIARAELALVATPGGIVVAPAPTDATVMVDGTALPPPWARADLLCGEHTVVVSAPDHVPDTRTIVIVATETVSVPVSLVHAAYGSLVLDVLPLDAQVQLDGESLGSGPRTVDHLPAGHHEVHVSLPRFQPATASVDLVADSTQRLTLHLNPAPAKTGHPARIVLNTGISLVGIGTATAAAIVYGEARSQYQEFLVIPDDDDAERFFSSEVQSREYVAAVLAGASLAALGSATALWVTTGHGHTTVGVSGTF